MNGYISVSTKRKMDTSEDSKKAQRDWECECKSQRCKVTENASVKHEAPSSPTHYLIMGHLITKARLSLTHWLRCPMLHKSKHIQLKKKRLAFNHSQSFPLGRVVKALDFRSGEDSTCRFDTRSGTGNFFFNDDGGASRSDAFERKAQASMRVQSTKPERAKRPRKRAQSAKSRERSNQQCEYKAQSLRERSDWECERKTWGSEATQSTCRNERSECRRSFLSKSERTMWVQSTKPEGAKRAQCRGSKATNNANAKHKAWGSKATENASAKLEGAKRPSQRAGMSAVNVGASFCPNLSVRCECKVQNPRERSDRESERKVEGAKRPTMRMRSTKPEGAKRLRMRAQSLRERSDRVNVPEWAQWM